LINKHAGLKTAFEFKIIYELNSIWACMFVFDLNKLVFLYSVSVSVREYLPVSIVFM